MQGSVLFVDDEVKVLHGLKRMLYGFRKDWNLVFVENGEQALNQMAQHPFDIIVSDMRMPGMDGAQLLKKVKEKYPNVVRVVLSGQADQKMILKSVGPTHQYLSKPCDPEKLKATLKQAITLRNILVDKRLQKLTSQIESLPSLPKLYLELMEELESPDTSIRRVGEIISRDVSMTAKILKLVNSAYFGLPRHVNSPMEAVNFLGLDTVKAMVLSAQVFAKYEEKKIKGLSLEELFNHSMQVGVLAKRILQEEGRDKAEMGDALLAGMLHDIGKLVLADNLPDQYEEVMEYAKGNGISHRLAEQKFLGVTHAEIGAHLLGLWGLQENIVETLAFHHFPGKSFRRKIDTLAAVHIANGIIPENDVEQVAPAESKLDEKFIEEIGAKDKLTRWKHKFQDIKEQE